MLIAGQSSKLSVCTILQPPLGSHKRSSPVIQPSQNVADTSIAAQNGNGDAAERISFIYCCRGGWWYFIYFIFVSHYRNVTDKKSHNMADSLKRSVCALITLYVHGVPKKTLVCVQRHLEASKIELQMIVGWVLKTSGNFQSNEHGNFVFSPKNVWDIKAQSWLPSP